MSARGRSVLAFATLGLWWGGWGALLPAVQRSVGVDDTRLGAALLFIGLGALASMRVTGYLVDRFGGVVLPASVAGLALAGVGPALASGAPALAASMAMLGATSGAYDVAVNAEGSRLESVSQRPLLSLGHAGFSFGVIGGSLGAGGLQAAGLSLLGTFATIGAVLVAVAGYLMARRAPRVRRAGSAGDDTRWRWWWPPRPLALLGGLLALAFLVESAWQTWSAVHLERDLGTSAGIASLGPAVFGGAAGIGRLLVHRWTAAGREGRIVAAGAVLAAAGTVAAALVPVTALVVAAIALAGVGTAACAPSLLSLAGRAVPRNLAGAGVGTVTTVGYLGFVIAPAVVGGVAGETTLPTALASVGIAAALLAGGAARLARQGP